MTFISILLGIILLIAIVMAFLLTKTTNPSTWKPFVSSELQSIIKRTHTSDPTQLRAAIFDLDSLLDYAFKGRQYRGNTMGERLKSAKGLYSRDAYNAIWEAHKLRNKLAHEPAYRPHLPEMQKGFRDLQSAVSAILNR